MFFYVRILPKVFLPVSTMPGRAALDTTIFPCRSTPEKRTMIFFCTYRDVTPDLQKSEKVSRTLKQRLGEEVYSILYQAVISDEKCVSKRHPMDKADAVYKSIVLGLAIPDGSRLPDYLAEPYVHEVFSLARAAGNEAHHLLGFLRFEELKNGVLIATVHPKHNILLLLADHFSDRLPQENFMIHDEGRQLAVLHKKGSPCVLTDASDLNADMITDYSSMELEYQKLWKGFFESIAIDARKNPALQNQNLPKRFRKDIVEFQ